MVRSGEENPDALLRRGIERILNDMSLRRYPARYFESALCWPGAHGGDLLQKCKALLRNPNGRAAAFEYKRRYMDGLTLEDIVIEYGSEAGFDSDDITIARETLGTPPPR